MRPIASTRRLRRAVRAANPFALFRVATQLARQLGPRRAAALARTLVHSARMSEEQDRHARTRG